MTLETSRNKERYVGNGSAKKFAFHFKVWKPSQVSVWLGDGSTEREVSSGCVVDVTSTGGSVTFGTAPKRNEIIVIRRSMPYIQEDDYVNGARFNGEEVEDRFDQDCAERQDLRLDVGRALKLPITSSKTADEWWADFVQMVGDLDDAMDILRAWIASIGSDVVGTLTPVIATGTTAIRTLGDRFADLVNVKDYGAKGNGTADDTAAFQAAFAAAGRNAVFVPRGVYPVDGVDFSRLTGDGTILWPTGRQISVSNIGSADKLCQTFWGEAYSMYNATIQDCSICRNDVDGKTYLFMCQQRSGTAYTADVVHVVTQYEMPDTAKDAPDPLTPYAQSNWTPVAQCLLTGKLGHGEGIYAVCRNGQFYLYGQACHQYAQDGTTIIRQARTGFTKTAWRGSETTEADVTTFYGLTEVQNPGQIALTPDAKTLMVCYSLNTYSGEDTENYYFWDSSAANSVVFYDLEALESAQNDQARENIPSIATYTFGRKDGLVVRSGLTSDGRYVYILTSAWQISGDESVGVYNFNGDCVKNIQFCAIGDAIKNKYFNGIEHAGYLYFPYQKEVEGLSIYNDTLYTVAKLHFARLASSGARYCTFIGKTYIAIKDSTNVLPTDNSYWAPTKRSFDDAVEWSSATTYTGLESSSEKLLHYRYIVGISPSGVYTYEWPLKQALWYNDVYDLSTSGNVLTMMSRNLASVLIGSLDTNFGSALPYAQFTKTGKLFLFDSENQIRDPSLPILSGQIKYRRNIDCTDYLGGTSHYGITAFMRCGKIDTRDDEAGGITFFTGNSDTGNARRRLYIVPDAGTIRVYDDLRPASDNESNIGNGNLWWKKGFFRELEIYGCCKAANVGTEADPEYVLRPIETNTTSLGTDGKRWSNVYASTTSISDSDERIKTGIGTIPDEVLDAWGDVEFQQFKFIDAVSQKGEQARIHLGLIAQRIQQAFSENGLDASRYGLFCYDEWEDEYEDIDVLDQQEVVDGQGNTVTPERSHVERRLVTHAGDRYSLRYEECLCMEVAYQRRELSRMQEQINQLVAIVAQLTSQQNN